MLELAADHRLQIDLAGVDGAAAADILVMGVQPARGGEAAGIEQQGEETALGVELGAGVQAPPWTGRNPAYDQGGGLLGN